ncbi:MAG: cell division protein FtsZ [Thaumarchaeota archaeon]|nr:MAG: cell division protein FtsZ [Candidatus Wolframiiraptor sp.]RLG03827.1 MAG: cell division protein FtsZ [Nitrososphaerota archaeon]HDD40182.1 cell division protein FtsZ [Nitrososphaeria archaeon]
MNEDLLLFKKDFSEEVKITLIGVGGAGCNTADRMLSMNLRGIKVIAANTDIQHLDMINAHQKLLLGKGTTKFRGAGGDPELGKMAVEESVDEVRAVLEGSDIVFVAAGLGGGTGTGGAPLVAEIARELGAIVIGVVTLPFKFEGNVRKRIALQGLEDMRNKCHTVVAIDNNKLLDLYPQYNLKTAFSLADEVISNMVMSITESIAKPSLINIDYADFKTVMMRGKLAALGVGKSSTPNRAEEATFSALQNPLLDVTYEGLTGAIIHVSAGDDMKISEAARPAEIISELMGEEALVIWGARIDNSLGSSLQVSLILTGVESTELTKPVEEEKKQALDEKEIEEIMEELGIKPLN